MPELEGATITGTVVDKPKTTLGWKAGLAAGWLAGAAMIGGPVAVDKANEAKAEAFADSVITAQLSNADVRTIEAKVENGSRQDAFTKYNSSYIYQKGDSVSVSVRNLHNDSLVSYLKVKTDTSALLVVKVHFKPYQEIKKPTDMPKIME